MSSSSLKAHFFIQMLRKSRFGSVEIEFPDGKKEIFGDGSPLIHVQVRRWDVFDLLFTKGDLGLPKRSNTQSGCSRYLVWDSAQSFAASFKLQRSPRGQEEYSRPL